MAAELALGKTHSNGAKVDMVAGVPVSKGPAGLLIADASLSNGAGAVDLRQFGNFNPSSQAEGLLVPATPEKTKAGPYHFVQMTDFGGESTRTDLANAEVELNLRSLAAKNNVEIGSVTQVPLEGFSTANTGFATAQLALYKDQGNIDRVFYVNTNPRLDPDDNRSWTDEDNFGKFVYVRLKNGNRIFTVNSKYALSFVKDEIEEGYVLNTDDNHQFLSRFQFIVPTMGVLSGDTSYFKSKLDISTIPDVPEGDWVAKDGNGNIKTSWRIGHLLKQPDIAESPYLAVTIGEGDDAVKRIAKNDLIKGRHHEIVTGDLVVRGGSSGYPDWEPPTSNQFVEVQDMFGSAVNIFGLSVVTDNTRVSIEPAPIDAVYIPRKIRRRELVGAGVE